MKYRVVEMVGGRFRCQYRQFFFWWIDSVHPPSTEMEEQIDYARSGERNARGVVRVVWP